MERSATSRRTTSACRRRRRTRRSRPADVNKDGATDFFFGRAGAPGVFAMSTGSARFVVSDAPAGTRDATSAQFVDYDNDGVLDLLVMTAAGARLWRNIGTALG